MKITIYSTSSCHYCDLAKDLFRELGVSYESFDVGKDLEKRKEMSDLSGSLGVPVIVINGKVIKGFDKETLTNEIKSGKKGK